MHTRCQQEFYVKEEESQEVRDTRKNIRSLIGMFRDKFDQLERNLVKKQKGNAVDDSFMFSVAVVSVLTEYFNGEMLLKVKAVLDSISNEQKNNKSEELINE